MQTLSEFELSRELAVAPVFQTKDAISEVKFTNVSIGSVNYIANKAQTVRCPAVSVTWRYFNLRFRPTMQYIILKKILVDVGMSRAMLLKEISNYSKKNYVDVDGSHRDRTARDNC